MADNEFNACQKKPSAIDRETQIHNLLKAFAIGNIPLHSAALELVSLSPCRFQHSTHEARRFILNNA